MDVKENIVMAVIYLQILCFLEYISDDRGVKYNHYKSEHLQYCLTK